MNKDQIRVENTYLNHVGENRLKNLSNLSSQSQNMAKIKLTLEYNILPSVLASTVKTFASSAQISHL